LLKNAGVVSKIRKKANTRQDIPGFEVNSYGVCWSCLHWCR